MMWVQTGWRGRVVLQYTINLPGGSWGEIWRKNIKAPWSYSTRSTNRRVGSYKIRSNAQRACENQLRNELRSALRALQKTTTVLW